MPFVCLHPLALSIGSVRRSSSLGDRMGVFSGVLRQVSKTMRDMQHANRGNVTIFGECCDIILRQSRLHSSGEAQTSAALCLL